MLAHHNHTGDQEILFYEEPSTILFQCETCLCPVDLNLSYRRTECSISYVQGRAGEAPDTCPTVIGCSRQQTPALQEEVHLSELAGSAFPSSTSIFQTSQRPPDPSSHSLP